MSEDEALDGKYRLEYEKLLKAFKKSHGEAVHTKAVASAALGGRE
jgi:hypothetical protein